MCEENIIIFTRCFLYRFESDCIYRVSKFFSPLVLRAWNGYNLKFLFTSWMWWLILAAIGTRVLKCCPRVSIYRILFKYLRKYWSESNWVRTLAAVLNWTLNISDYINTHVGPIFLIPLKTFVLTLFHRWLSAIHNYASFSRQKMKVGVEVLKLPLTFLQVLELSMPCLYHFLHSILLFVLVLSGVFRPRPVSYTHLTLPTIYSV